jgi:type II secretory pathway component PulM
MKTSPWLSATLRRLNARERRVVAGGAAVSAIALFVVLLMLPFIHQWSAREAAIGASRDQWTRLQALVSGESRLRRALDTVRLAQQSVRARLLTGPTAAVAASNLQVLLQRYADESAVQLDRVDAVGEPEASREGLLAIPVRLQVHGDVYGLVDFLYRLQHGEKLLVTDELGVNAGLESTMGSQSLTWSVRLHGLYPASAQTPQPAGAGS